MLSKNKKITEKIVGAYKSNKIDENYLMNLVIQGKAAKKKRIWELFNSSQLPSPTSFQILS